jgi:hypothetical protein
MAGAPGNGRARHAIGEAPRRQRTKSAVRPEPRSALMAAFLDLEAT